MPYGDIADQDQHWRYQIITWTNVVLSSIVFCDSHRRPTSQEELNISICEKEFENCTFKIINHIFQRPMS